MRTAIETNVLSVLLDGQAQGRDALVVLRYLEAQGPLLICGVVYAELHGRQDTPPDLIERFLQGTGIELDSVSSRDIWEEAGRANASQHARRRRGGIPGVRPVLPDLLIGAHALHRADRLLTRNTGDFSDFPALELITY
ncbi:type II toxin-antitoxin system VapC family toxin [Deinococcus altitudinis]|uniref:type II toxin-antitoxin system VapC family toxin n=1 Tax=Deinococcus altitudinis TaxID=468914 RepID=UPI003891AC77